MAADSAKAPNQVEPGQCTASFAALTDSTPRVVRIFGMIYMIFFGVAIAFWVIADVLTFAQSGQPSRIWIGALRFSIFLVGFLIGKGLRSGRRMAIIGLMVIGLLALIPTIGALAAGQLAPSVVLLALVSVLAVPPIISGLRNWATLT